MTNNPNNIRLSACRVRWGGRDLGLTKGGVDVTIKTETKPVQVDQFGNTLVNEVILGRTVTVKCPFAETDLDTLYAITKASGATLTDSGTVATGTLTFSGVPLANDTIVINGHTFTYVASLTNPVTKDTVLIGADPVTTIANTVTALQQSSDPAVLAGTYVGSATTLTVNYYRSGVTGNSFTLAATGTKITTSGATLTGGVDGTRNVQVVTGVGTSLLAAAQSLVLHPADLVDQDTSQDFTVPYAGQSGSIAFSYKIDAERIYMVEFTGYPNASSGELFKFGA